MKSQLALLLTMANLSAFASEIYVCKSMQKINPRGTEEMVIKRSLFSNKVKSVELINKLEANELQATKNPFLTEFAQQFKINQEAVEATKGEIFKKITDRMGSGDTSITLSQSLIDGEEVGFASYYSHFCLFLECNTYAYFFKCTKP